MYDTVDFPNTVPLGFFQTQAEAAEAVRKYKNDLLNPPHLDLTEDDPIQPKAPAPREPSLTKEERLAKNKRKLAYLKAEQAKRAAVAKELEAKKQAEMMKKVAEVKAKRTLPPLGHTHLISVVALPYVLARTKFRKAIYLIQKHVARSAHEKCYILNGGKVRRRRNFFQNIIKEIIDSLLKNSFAECKNVKKIACGARYLHKHHNCSK